MNHEHVHCGGELTPRKSTPEELHAINKQRKKEHKRPWESQDLYFCDKCKEFVSVFTGQTYKDYVKNGWIKEVN